MQRNSGCGDAQLAAHLDPVAVGQAHVEHGHVGADGGDPLQGLRSRARLADDLEVVVGLQQVAHAAADDLVVVEQEDARSERPRDRRCRARSRSDCTQRAAPAGPTSLVARGSLPACRSRTAAPPARRSDGGRLGARPADGPAAHRPDGDRSGRRALRRAGRARRIALTPRRVHHRRHRRRRPCSDRAAPRRATASSGCSSSTPGRCAFPTSPSTPTASASRRTIRR